MRYGSVMVLIAGVWAAGVACAGELADLAGTWRTQRHGALVQVGDCGDATPCGQLVWVDARMADGQTQDVRNRDPSLRQRGLIGVPIVWGFAAQAGGWHNGWVYNPDDGKTFRARLKLLSAHELRVTGCLGPLCRSEVWTRELKHLAPQNREVGPQ